MMTLMMKASFMLSSLVEHIADTLQSGQGVTSLLVWSSALGEHALSGLCDLNCSRFKFLLR